MSSQKISASDFEENMNYEVCGSKEIFLISVYPKNIIKNII